MENNYPEKCSVTLHLSHYQNRIRPPLTDWRSNTGRWQVPQKFTKIEIQQHPWKL